MKPLVSQCKTDGKRKKVRCSAISQSLSPSGQVVALRGVGHAVMWLSSSGSSSNCCERELMLVSLALRRRSSRKASCHFSVTRSMPFAQLFVCHWSVHTCSTGAPGIFSCAAAVASNFRTCRRRWENMRKCMQLPFGTSLFPSGGPDRNPWCLPLSPMPCMYAYSQRRVKTEAPCNASGLLGMLGRAIEGTDGKANAESNRSWMAGESADRCWEEGRRKTKEVGDPHISPSHSFLGRRIRGV